MSAIEQFGIEPKLFITQLVNFGLLAIVLWKWVLPKLTTLMEQRKHSIETSLAAAEKARAEAVEADKQREVELKQAREQALTIITEAKKEAKVEAEKVIAGAKTEADSIVKRSERQLATEAAKLRTELRAELAGLTIETTRRVLSQVVKPEDSDRILKEAIATVKEEDARSH